MIAGMEHLQEQYSSRLRFSSIGESAGKEGVTYYQIDFVAGDTIEDLRSDEGYYTPDRLIRFVHGSSEEPITRRSNGEFATDGEFAGCVESNEIAVENGTAEIEVDVVEDCEPVDFTLASYETRFGLESRNRGRTGVRRRTGRDVRPR